MEKKFLAMLIGLIIVLAAVFAVAVSYQAEIDSKDKVILNVTDAYITQTFSCNILENRTLVDANHTVYVLHVDNVEYLGQEIHFLQGA